MKTPYVRKIDGIEVGRSFWHEDCKTCDNYLSMSVEEQRETQAEWINGWYRDAISTLKGLFTELCESKDVEEPDYFPGRHWLSDLKDMWMELFPDSDSSTYNQICGDVLTILGLDLIFFDLESPNIETLHDYLIDNYETARKALARIATNMKALEVADDIIQSEKSEIPTEDGSVVYYYGGEPSLIFLGGTETEQQLNWRKLLPDTVAHPFNPYMENQTKLGTTENNLPSTER